MDEIRTSSITTTRKRAEKARAPEVPYQLLGCEFPHNAKAKGKEVEVLQPVAISEDEFELVMGVFEKVAHEHTEFLHHVRLYRCLKRFMVYEYFYRG